jgi:hypothetical protein
MLISASDFSPPAAFVLSNLMGPSLYTCPGQQLFSFDPLLFSSNPTWFLNTIAASGSACLHLGLTFGRNENLLYALSIYNSKSTIILLDIKGNT